MGELLENQFRIGLVRMNRAIKEKMSVLRKCRRLCRTTKVNAKPVMAAIREFFGSSQLSQFMDQTNPLSEITHKRRLSALGPGGLSRERDVDLKFATCIRRTTGVFARLRRRKVRNIGLISSLSCFARINDYGSGIESPYRRVKDGVVVDEVRIFKSGLIPSSRSTRVMLRGDAEKANNHLAAKKQPAEMEPHCDYLSAWEEDTHHRAGERRLG